MKKIICSVLAAALASSAIVAVNAQETVSPEEEIMLISANPAEEDIMLIDENLDSESDVEIMEVQVDKITYSGVVSEIGEDFVVVGENEFQFNTDENTYICDYDLNPYTELKEGDMVTAVVSTMTTRSLPPQAYAFYIFVNSAKSMAAPIFAVVDTNENGEIMSADGNNKIVYTDETPVIANKIKIALKAQDITPGSEIVAFATTVGMSLPAHVPAEKIAVLNLAPVEETEETEKEETIEVEGIADVEKIVVDGEVYDAVFDLLKDGEDVKLPLRAVCEGLGYNVLWNGEDRSVKITAGETDVTVKIGQSFARSTDVPVIVNDRTYTGISLFNILFGETAVAEINGGIITVTTK